jgi:hypothetical protein
MADWRNRGVVPDSDDDGLDEFDSQISAQKPSKETQTRTTDEAVSILTIATKRDTKIVCPEDADQVHLLNADDDLV